MLQRILPAALVLAALSCDAPTGLALDRTAQLRGTLQLPQGESGDAWFFLYAPGEGPPGAPAVPRYVSAISRGRLSSGDRRFIFAGLAPNPYRLWGFLDGNGNFEPTPEVLAQPGAGDRIASGAELNLQPGSVTDAALALGAPLPFEPPACAVEGGLTDVRLDAAAPALASLTLVPDTMGERFEATQQGFRVGLVDADGDGRADDPDGDGLPALSLQAFLRRKAPAGQAASEPDVIVPLALNPAPFLAALGGQVGIEAVVDRVQFFVLPQAQQRDAADGGLRPLGAPPAGDYELVLLTGGGGFWLLPNGLAPEVASQGVRLHFDGTGG